MKLFTVVLLSLSLIALAGCASTGGGGGSAAIGNASGTASGTAAGFGGNITVTVTMANGMITDVVVDGPSETAGIGSTAVARAPALIMEYNSAQFDAVSGATISSMAIADAAQTAIDAIVAGN